MQHPGSTDFDVKDRLAIINLCNAYADGYDRNEMDRWFALFTDDIELTTRLSDGPTWVISGDAFKEALRQNRLIVADAGRMPLHCDTNLNIKQQTSDRAIAEAYMLYVPREIAALNNAEKTLTETRITGTARYSFNLLKGDDSIWRIDSYTIIYDQKVVEESTDLGETGR